MKARVFAWMSASLFAAMMLTACSDKIQSPEGTDEDFVEGDYTFTYNDEAVEFSKAVFDTHPSEDGCWWLCASTSGKMWDEYVYLSMFISPLVPGETEQQLDIEEFTFMLPLSSDSRNMAAGEFMLDGDICFALQEN